MQTFSHAGKLLSVALSASLLTAGFGLQSKLAIADDEEVGSNSDLVATNDQALASSVLDETSENIATGGGANAGIEAEVENDANTANLIASAQSQARSDDSNLISVQASGDPTAEEAADRIFTFDTVTLKNMPVTDVNQNPINEEITFTFWNATMERFEGTAKSVNGVLEDKEVYKGHRYIAFCESKTWNFSCTCGNAYFILNETGNQPLNDRSKTEGAILPRFQLKQRNEAVADAKEARRVKVELTLWLYDTDYDDFDDDSVLHEDFPDLKIKFTNAYGDSVLSSTPDENGNITVSLFEDMPYMLSVESDTLSVLSYPVVVKDHSEQDQPKKAYDHFSCGQRGIVLFYTEQFDDGVNSFNTTLTSTSGKTTIEGIAFNQHTNKNMPIPMKQVAAAPRYGLTERIMEKTLADSGLQGDFEVYDFATINLARSEKSNLMTDGYQTFKITTEIADSNKTVASISYINSDGKLVPVKFTKNGNKISWTSTFVGVYPYVIQYVTGELPKRTYEPVNADNVVFDPSKGDELIFTFKAAGDTDDSYENFSGLEIDGNLVAKSNYTVKKGSTIVTLTPEFAATLGEGNHTVKALFEGGTQEASINFTISEDADPTEPTDPTDPTEPTDPSNPTDPSSPIDPSVTDDENIQPATDQVSDGDIVVANNTQVSTLSKTGDVNFYVFGSLLILALMAGGVTFISIARRKSNNK